MNNKKELTKEDLEERMVIQEKEYLRPLSFEEDHYKKIIKKIRWDETLQLIEILLQPLKEIFTKKNLRSIYAYAPIEIGEKIFNSYSSATSHTLREIHAGEFDKNEVLFDLSQLIPDSNPIILKVYNYLIREGFLSYRKEDLVCLFYDESHLHYSRPEGHPDIKEWKKVVKRNSLYSIESMKMLYISRAESESSTPPKKNEYAAEQKWCIAPLNIIAKDPNCCEYLEWIEKKPVCLSPIPGKGKKGDCPDFNSHPGRCAPLTVRDLESKFNIKITE